MDSHAAHTHLTSAGETHLSDHAGRGWTAGPCAPAAPRASHNCGAKTENSLLIAAVI